MRRPLLLATTAGALLAAGLVAGPALGATRGPGNGAGPGSGTCTCATEECVTPGAGNRNGLGPGSGMADRRGDRGQMGTGNGMGRGAGPGQHQAGDPLAGLAQGTLTAAQKTQLAAMAEEEKLAHDVYVALATSSGDRRFTRIAAAETRHLEAVRALLARYGVSDPTAGKAAGVFASERFQQLYRDLVARGDDSREAALAVGREIEKADIADLATATAGVTAPDVRAVYARLTAGSQQHLRAFGG